MSDETLFAHALKLPLEKRAQLAAALLRSLDGEPEDDLDGAWAAEIASRMQDIRAGTAQVEDWGAVRERARDRLRRR